MMRLAIPIVLAACASNADTPTPPIDPTGTWNLSEAFHAVACHNGGGLTRTLTVTGVVDHYAISDVAFPNDAFSSELIDCDDTECQIAFQDTFTDTEGSLLETWTITLDADKTFTGSGTSNHESTACAQPFTVTGTKS